MNSAKAEPISKTVVNNEATEKKILLSETKVATALRIHSSILNILSLAIFEFNNSIIA